MTPATSVTRLTLMPAAGEARSSDAQRRVRRYRLARVQALASASRADRFAHLKRAYD